MACKLAVRGQKADFRNKWLKSNTKLTFCQCQPNRLMNIKTNGSIRGVLRLGPPPERSELSAEQCAAVDGLRGRSSNVLGEVCRNLLNVW